MERFRKIDWHPALEDMIDDVFIRDERMERESAMYRIMNNCFTDPFEDIESEYAEVNVELIKKYLREDGDDLADMEEEDPKVKNNSKTGNKSMQDQELKSYVPGIRKRPCNFPRRSRLSNVQQAMCLRVLLRISDNSSKRPLTEEERVDLQQYMALQETISEEQKEFLEFVKSKWNDTFDWWIKCKTFLISKWKMKMQRFEEIPRYYIESINIPLSVQKINLKTKNIKVKFISCLQQESFSEVVLPKLNQPCRLHLNSMVLRNKYQVRVAPNKVMQHFRLPVSEDTYCESLAMEAGADFVISSSGLKCFLNNIDPDHTNTWVIPVVVKSHHGKNVVYINKKLPPTVATIPQKNTWVFKYILRYHFVKSKSSERGEADKPEKAADHSDSDGNDSNSSDNHLKIYEEDLYLSDSDKSEKLDDVASSNKTDPKMNKKQNVSYKLFTIGPTESLDHERMKHEVKEYQMLVRTKTDGIETLSDGNTQPLILAPKMEHQLSFGAEAVTLEEGMHQWALLKFRPKTSLARVRIATDSTEVIQIERHTTWSLGNEIKRLYNVKVEDSLSILHNIIEGLLSLTPGQYIMQHVPANGPFAYVYKQTEECGKNVFDLHTICQSAVFHTIPRTPWPPIDNMMITPMIKCFKKMPAMFNPTFARQFSSRGRPKGRSKKNASVANNQGSSSSSSVPQVDSRIPALPRRSIRLNKTE